MNNSDYRLPLLGERFPEVEVKTTQGIKKLPQDYAGKWFILFSHPGDFTPVCTTEFIEFANRHEDFRQLNTELIGLSVDQVFSHIKWIEWIKETMKVDIKFPVIADELGNLASKLGMLHPNKGTNTVRAVFIVDPNGNLRTMLYYPQEIGRSIAEVLRVVKALQTTDTYKVATPANWPENPFLGDHVIIPPASNEQDAAERLARSQKGEFEYFDWWFCHKKL